MEFGPVPVAAALGAILAHSQHLPDGPLRKGCVLGPSEVARLQAAGLSEVIVARPGPGEVTEDAAALTLARAVAGPGLRLGPATTGRVNLMAEGAGLLQVDAARVAALNAVHPQITLATLPPLQRVAAGDMVATIKIISYAVPSQALALAATGPALRLLPPGLSRAHLVETVLPGDEVPSDKGARALGQRLRRLGVSLGPRAFAPHRTEALAAAIRARSEGTEILFLLTASATCDPQDVGPEALRQAGGTVSRFGIPVDPGNLLFLGALGGVPVIGLPGCARSPALNGADWVLERVICGVPPTTADLAAMGVGGLLKESPARGRPRAQE